MLRRSNAYWDTRSMQRMAAYQRDANNTMATITAAHDKAVDNLNKEISKIFATYARGSGLSTAEARRLLSQPISAREWEAIKSGLDAMSDPALRQRALATLNAPAYAARINRLQAIRAQAYVQAKILADVEIRASTKGYMRTIRGAYTRTMFDLQKGLGMGFEFAGIPSRTVEAILRNPWSGRHFSARVWDNTDELARRMAEVITGGLMSGAGNRQMALELMELSTMGRHAANRLVRTETTYMANAAEMESYKEAGIEKYIFLATLDSRTSEECREADLKIFDMPGVAGENLPPLHPYCVLPDMVIASPDADAITKSYYSGEVIKLTTANGRGLSITQNHIMLTSRGWVRAKDIVKGDKIVYYRGWDEFVVEPNPTEDEGVTTVEKLFASLIELCPVPPVTVPAAAEHFKGDVVEGSEISVIPINGLLRGEMDPTGAKLLSDFPLVRASKLGEAPLPIECLASHLLVAAGLASDGVVRGLDIAQILLSGTFAHHEFIGLRLASHYDARLLQTAGDNRFANRKLSSDGRDALAGFVESDNFRDAQTLSGVGVPDLNPLFLQNPLDRVRAYAENTRDFCEALPEVVLFDDVVNVERVHFSGHVYDISSQSTLYYCNGFLSSNCRSTTRAYLGQDTLKGLERRARDPVTGKNTLVPGDMSYREWQKKFAAPPPAPPLAPQPAPLPAPQVPPPAPQQVLAAAEGG